MLSDSEFLKVVEGLRFAGPDTRVDHMLCRHMTLPNGVRVEVRCSVCSQNIWEEYQPGAFRCWNCIVGEAHDPI